MMAWELEFADKVLFFLRGSVFAFSAGRGLPKDSLSAHTDTHTIIRCDISPMKNNAYVSAQI